MSTFNWSKPVAYDAQAKSAFLRAARVALFSLARELQLGVVGTDHDLRINKAGIAVSGEVTLHTDNVYVQVQQSALGDLNFGILIRTCAGRKDYTGDQNHWLPLSKLNDIPALARYVQKVMTS